MKNLKGALIKGLLRHFCPSPLHLPLPSLGELEPAGLSDGPPPTGSVVKDSLHVKLSHCSAGRKEQGMTASCSDKAGFGPRKHGSEFNRSREEVEEEEEGVM